MGEGQFLESQNPVSALETGFFAPKKPGFQSRNRVSYYGLMPIQIHTIESQPFAENSYVVWREGSAEAFVVDPGFEPEAILDFLTERGLALAALVNTHGHVDHLAGNADVKRAFPAAPIIVCPGDAPMPT